MAGRMGRLGCGRQRREDGVPWIVLGASPPGGRAPERLHALGRGLIASGSSIYNINVQYSYSIWTTFHATCHNRVALADRPALPAPGSASHRDVARLPRDMAHPRSFFVGL